MATRVMTAYYYVGRDKDTIPINFSAWTEETDGYQHTAAKIGMGVVNQHVNVQGNHSAVIRDIAAKSNILLKNSGALPLTGKEKVTAVIGEDSSSNPGGPNACGDRGCDTGTLAMGWGSGTANFPSLVAPIDAITSAVGTNGKVVSAINNYDIQAISAAASGADVAIVFCQLGFWRRLHQRRRQ